MHHLFFTAAVGNKMGHVTSSVINLNIKLIPLNPYLIAFLVTVNPFSYILIESLCNHLKESAKTKTSYQYEIVYSEGNIITLLS